jgi:hypothetical protein
VLLLVCLQGKQLAEAALLNADTNRLRVAAHTLLGRCCHALEDFQGAQQNYAQVCLPNTCTPLFFIIITRFAGKRQSRSIKYHDRDTLRHDNLTGLQASLQVKPVTAGQTLVATVSFAFTSCSIALGFV